MKTSGISRYTVALKNKGKGAEREKYDTINAGNGRNLPGKPYSESLTIFFVEEIVLMKKVNMEICEIFSVMGTFTVFFKCHFSGL